MAFTQIQFDTLNNALSQGVLKVKYADKEVTYQSLHDMLELRRLMALELGLIDNGFQRNFAEHNKGFSTKSTDDNEFDR